MFHKEKKIISLVLNKQSCETQFKCANAEAREMREAHGY